MKHATYLPQELIRRKRDGQPLAADEIEAFVRGLTDGSVTDAQIAAFAMAVHFQGMSDGECVALTQAMTRSGERLVWSDLDLGGPILDKHSTGGLGDKVSLLLAPLVAACGGYVPMISGRGLGHTGGTLDKLESIPGYNVTPTISELRHAVRAAGCAIVGQTGQLAPADDRFYAIRDVTATVDPIALITASILSKKLAAGLDVLVMDVKFGSGAFSPDEEEAARLAQSLVRVATEAGLPTTALITDMNQVLGRSAGNAVEVRECLAYLRGDVRDERLHELVTALTTALLVRGTLTTAAEAPARIEDALASGRAAEHFARMVTALGGPADLLEHPQRHLPTAPLVLPVHAAEDGIVQHVHGRRLGMILVEMGAGRRHPDDEIDAAVGITDVLGRGETTRRDRPLLTLHARNEAQAARAAAALRACFVIADDALTPGPLVVRTVEASA